MVAVIEFVKIGLSVPIFLYACYKDYHERRVPDKVWLPLFALAFLIIPFEFNYDYFVSLLISVGVILPLSFFMLYFNFGGADAKFLILLSILFPEYPTVFNPVFLDGWVFTFSVLLNSLLITLIYPLTIFSLNIWRKNFVNPLRMITSIKKRVYEVKDSDKITEGSLFGEEKDLSEFGEEELVWVTPGIPFIIPMVAGYFIALVYGDIWFSIMLL